MNELRFIEKAQVESIFRELEEIYKTYISALLQLEIERDELIDENIALKTQLSEK